MYGKTRAGVNLPLLMSGEGELITQAVGGDYADAAINGRLFYAANQTATNTSATYNNVTFLGLGLANPTGSGKLYLLQEFGYALTAACAAEAVLALATTTESGFAASITVRCCRNGYAASNAMVDEAATIIAPIVVKVIGSVAQGIDTTQFMPPPTIVKLGGSIILAAGRAVVTSATVALGASVQFSYLWEEIDA